MAFGVLLLGVALVSLGGLLTEGLWAPAARMAVEGLVGVAASAVGLFVLLWWIVAFCGAVAAELLARGGHHRGALRAGRFSPAFMRKLAVTVLGLQLVTAPIAQAYAAAPERTSAVKQVQTDEEAAGYSPLWAATEAPQIFEPQWRPTAPPAGAGLLVKANREAAPTGGGRTAEVVVQPGDSLWSIAARHLGPMASDAAVAKAWPQWFAANKHAIGENPDVLLPGQVLQAPDQPK